MLRRWSFFLLMALLGAAAWCRADASPALAHYRGGVALEKAGSYERAAAEFDAALAEDPTLVQARRELGRCLYLLGWKDRALDELRAYLDSGVRDAPYTALYESMTAQGSAVGAFDDGEPPPLALAGPLSLQADLGYAWGLNNANFGHRYNRENNANPFVYSYEVGEGMSGQIEAVYDFSPNVGLGLSVRPMLTGTQGAESITYEGLTTTSDSTQLGEAALPVLLNLHLRSRLGGNLKVTGFFGAGAVFSRPYIESSKDVESDATGTYDTNVRYQRDLNAGLALSGGFGLEFLLSPHCSFFLNSALLLAQMAPSAASYSSQTYNSSGVLVASSADSDSYVAFPPKTQAVDPVTATSGSTTTYTYDNGPTQYTETVTPTSDTFSETNLLSAGTDLVSFKVIAATAGLRWEF